MPRPPTSLPERLVAVATLIGIAAWLLIAGLNEPIDFPAWYRCPLHAMTGVLCPGCGSTRATHALLNADPALSLRNNPLFILLAVPALALLVRGAVLRAAGRESTVRFLPGWTGYAVLALVLGFWIARNIPLAVLEPLRPVGAHHHADPNHSRDDGTSLPAASTIAP